MTRALSLAVVTSLLLIFAPAATAAGRAPVAANAAEMDGRMAAALDLLDAMGGREAVMTQIGVVIPAQMQALKAQFPDMTREMRQTIEASMREEMTKGVNHLLTGMARAWARRFSAQDLRAIAAFHRSPAGRNLRKEQEDLQREIAEIGRNWGVEIGKRIQERLRDQLAKPPALTS